MTASHPTLKHATIKPGKLYINGEFRDASDGATFETINPANELPITTVARASVKDADDAVAAAKAAFTKGKWATWPTVKRAQLIRAIAEKILAHKDELAELESIDAGKPIRETSTIDVPMAADVFMHYAGLARAVTGDTIPFHPAFLNYTLKEPVGVVGSITPWNFPILMAAWKLAPALAAGCTVVLKPAEVTPLTACRLAELIHECGLPPGVVNVIPGKGSVAGQRLVDHPDVDKISFTGSTPVGIKIMQDAAKTMKKVTLELGGKSPNVIFADSDVENAIKAAQQAIFYNKGEVCTAGSRLLVESKVFDEVVEKLAARTAKMGHGDPLDPETRLGPQVSKAQLDSVLGYVASGKADGARLVAGGERAGDRGYFVKPTVFADVSVGSKIFQEEIFGPVVAVSKFEDFDDLMAKANGTQFGLASAVWTRDISKAHKFARAVKAGTCWVNCYGLFDAAVPFGGYKMSGIGRDNGWSALEGYLVEKSVWVSLG
jgi:acyl-CoA reductase-like NAD-dependent aldehyde dehydrogenase